jgi:hypothetical protein
MDTLSYYDKLVDAFEVKYGKEREAGLRRLRELCENNRHI